MPKKPVRSAVCAKFAKAVRTTREQRGYSQEGFARHAGMDRSYFAAIERGEFNVSLNTMVRIAVALDTKASALLGLARL